eukprot:5776497-Pleurochrysis_carterae.AAC.1
MSMCVRVRGSCTNACVSCTRAAAALAGEPWRARVDVRPFFRAACACGGAPSEGRFERRRRRAAAGRGGSLAH